MISEEIKKNLNSETFCLKNNINICEEAGILETLRILPW